jgi:hypothetical protein
MENYTGAYFCLIIGRKMNFYGKNSILIKVIVEPISPQQAFCLERQEFCSWCLPTSTMQRQFQADNWGVQLLQASQALFLLSYLSIRKPLLTKKCKNADL